MKQVFVLAAFIIFLSHTKVTHSQSRFPGFYMVSFIGKPMLSPSANFTQKSIDRRIKNGIDFDSLDLPVNPNYIDSIISISNKVKHVSRWTNSVLVEIVDTNIFTLISSVSFVKSVIYLSPGTDTIENKKLDDEIEEYTLNPRKYGAAKNQIKLIGLTELHSIERKGEGVLIAVLDAGFNNVDKMEAFDKLRQNSGIVGSLDVVNPGNSVFNSNSHGSNVLSVMAANIDGKYLGTAPDANYYLIRTEEVATEYPVEEYYWMVGAEFADSIGADIITSSLSYTTFDDTTLNHSHSQADGFTTIISRAATIAASRGILVFQSAGNEGDGSWRKIGFPADAIGIIAVGAIDTTGKIADLSSVGNTTDGRIKPDLVAVGYKASLVNTYDKIFFGNGTSFSTPLLAGASACLMQQFPTMKSSEIRNYIIANATRANEPDSIYGYGIPNFYRTTLAINNFSVPSIDTNNSFVTLPNPFSNGFFLVFEADNFMNIEITISDMNGKIVKTQKQNGLKPGFNSILVGDLENLKLGVYSVSIRTGEKSYTLKVIK